MEPKKEERKDGTFAPSEFTGGSSPAIRNLNQQNPVQKLNPVQGDNPFDQSINFNQNMSDFDFDSGAPS